MTTQESPSERGEKLPPWAHGPLELIRHAHGHRLAGGDHDRRIALIGFDNAIEVCIDAFIRLHPRLRGGHQIPKAEREQATRNYHTKIEFLDGYIDSSKLPHEIDLEEVVWFHQLRNELYHSGNGMVPEQRVVDGSMRAALSVFNALFGVDATNHLDDAPLPREASGASVPSVYENAEMEFLREYIDLERTVGQKLKEVSEGEGAERLPFVAAWRKLTGKMAFPDHFAEVADRARILRNSIVHGQSHELDHNELTDVTLAIMEMEEHIRNSRVVR